MKTKFLSILAALAFIGLAFVGPNAHAASANTQHLVEATHVVNSTHAAVPMHFYDPLAQLVCEVEKPASNWNVAHAVPTYLTPTYVEEWCEATLINHLPVRYYGIYVFGPPGEIHFAGGYYNCGIFGCLEP